MGALFSSVATAAWAAGLASATPLLVFPQDLHAARGLLPGLDQNPSAQVHYVVETIAGHAALLLTFNRYIPSKNNGWPTVSFALGATASHLTNWAPYGSLRMRVRNPGARASDLGLAIGSAGVPVSTRWYRYFKIPAHSAKMIQVSMPMLARTLNLCHVDTLEFFMRFPKRRTHVQILGVSLTPTQLGAPGEMRLILSVPHLRATYYPSSRERRLAGRVILHLAPRQVATLKLELSLGGTVIKTWTPPTPGANCFSLPRPTFGVSRALELQVTLRTSHGKVIDHLGRILRLAGKTPDAVTFRADGQCLVNGHPFYPIGVFQAPISAFKGLQGMGMNTVQLYGCADHHYLLEAKKHDLRVITEVRGIPLTVAQRYTNHWSRAMARQYVRRVGRSGDILAYYLFDEPDVSEVSPAFLTARSKVVEQGDWYHPTTGVCNRQMGDFVGASDVLMVDTYPIPGSWDYLLSRLVESRRSLEGGGVLWHVPQCFPWQAYDPGDKRGRAPTFDEMRAMVYTGLAFGARGTIFYSYAVQGFAIKDAYPHLWQAFGDVIKEMHGLRRVLAARCGPLRVMSSSPRILCTTREYAGQEYLFVVNSSPAQTIHAVLTLRHTARQTGRWIVVSEGRTVPVRDGVLQDTFRPLAVHIYTTASHDPSPIRLAEVRADLAKAQQEHPLPLPDDLADIEHGASIRSSFGWLKNSRIPGWKRMIDGYPGTDWVVGNSYEVNGRWQKSALKGKRWIEVDFPHPERVGRLVAITSGVKPTLEIRHAGQWTGVPSRTRLDQPSRSYIMTTTTTTARFPALRMDRFRLEFTNRQSGKQGAIFELEAYRQ